MQTNCISDATLILKYKLFVAFLAPNTYPVVVNSIVEVRRCWNCRAAYYEHILHNDFSTCALMIRTNWPKSGHILQTHCPQKYMCSKMYMLCRQIEERSLHCRGVYMDILYECIATCTHFTNTLSLDVKLLQKHTY